jgi:hypothetical protein
MAIDESRRKEREALIERMRQISVDELRCEPEPPTTPPLGWDEVMRRHEEVLRMLSEATGHGAATAR